MAIGLGKMLGFKFLENFNYPYISLSIREFWRRWHISLSSWFRDYLYIPLGGNRAGVPRTWFNLLVVFVFCGLWHGASWNFLVWGLIHGAFLVMERTVVGRALETMYRPLRHIYVMLVVMFAWVFFRAETLPDALGWLTALAGLNDAPAPEIYIGKYFDFSVLFALVIGIVGASPVKNLLPRLFGNMVVLRMLSRYVWIMSIFVLSIAYMAAGTFNPFIYFRF